MSSEIPVTQAREELADLINRVAYGHERIVLTRHSKPVACLVPPEDLARLEEREQEGVEQERFVSYTKTVTDQQPQGPAPRSSGPSGPMPIAARHQPPGPLRG
jgi:prevent-host-death family protein